MRINYIDAFIILISLFKELCRVLIVGTMLIFL